MTLGDAIERHRQQTQHSSKVRDVTTVTEPKQTAQRTSNWLLILAVCAMLSVPIMASAEKLGFFEPEPDERSIASTLLKKGVVVVTGTGINLATSGQLPESDFHIRSLSFTEQISGRPLTVYADDLQQWLPVLPHVDTIDLVNCALQDESLPVLARQPRLSDIKLSENWDLTANGLRQLKASPRLTALSISDLGPDMWQALSEFSNLRAIDIAPRTMTDGAVVTEGLSNLKRLHLVALNSAPYWTDADLVKLATLPRLRNLRVSKSKITDEGLIEFAAAVVENDIPLQVLQLDGNFGLTDASSESLSQLKTLAHLDLQFTQFSSAEVERLKLKLPTVEILF